LISEIDGVAEIVRNGDSRRIRIKSSELYGDEYEENDDREYDVDRKARLKIEDGDWIPAGRQLTEGSAIGPRALAA
jgi:hypothetical protein